MRFAVTGSSAGMSTRAALPATALIELKACGGTGLTTAKVRSEASILVRAAIADLATTTFEPLADAGKRYGALASAAAARNATSASAVPMMMYRRLRRGRPMAPEIAI